MKKVVIVAAAMTLGACQIPERVSQGEALGALGGAALGTFVGLQFGGGVGNILFGILGGAGGAAAGYNFGRQLDPSDRAQIRDTTRRAMAQAGDGELVPWSNRATGSVGTITPVNSYYAGNGVYCRDFRASVAIKVGVGEGRGRACRVGAGGWQIANAG